jgi:hypothetical protein
MIRTVNEPFSTLVLVGIPSGADPASEPLLGHAGVLIQGGRALPTWDGVSGVSRAQRRFLTTTEDDLTAPELRAIGSRLTGDAGTVPLSERSAARVDQVHEGALRLLMRDGETSFGAPEPTGAPDPA